MIDEKPIYERLDRGDADAAATLAIEQLGPQVLGYLTAVLRSEDEAREVFSQFAEDLWKGLTGFRRESSLRTWAFALAWHAASRHARDPYRKRNEHLATSMASKVAASVRSSSMFQPGSRAERLFKLRQSLEADEQTLLILRLDKQMAWEEIATVLSAEGEPVAPPALRKRFERLKEKLAKLAKEQGLLDPPP
jgi:RNA polymerase sigma-70 factor (ECF subfamily)